MATMFDRNKNKEALNNKNETFFRSICIPTKMETLRLITNTFYLYECRVFLGRYDRQALNIFHFSTRAEEHCKQKDMNFLFIRVR